MSLCDRCLEEIGGVELPPDLPRLRVIEHHIFSLLWARRNRPFVSRESLMNVLYQDSAEPPFETALSTHIYYLRKRLRGSQFSVETIRGFGYRAIENDARP